jgi:hypothetical protein
VDWSSLKRRRRTFAEWWREPPTKPDRLLAFIVGGIGGFWVGLLGRVLLGPMPVSSTAVFEWAFGVAAFLALAGIAFPKPVTVALLPFSTFGGS